MSGVEVMPLGKVVKPSRPRVKPSDYPDLPFIGMEHVEAHSMKLLGTVPAATMKSSAVHFKPGDVLYGRLRPYLNKVYRPAFEGLCSAEFIVLAENERVDGGYLQYLLNSSAFVRFASHLNSGDRPRVDFDQLAPYEIPLPKVDEQRRIVAEIEKQFSRLDEAVANLKRAKANLKRYKSAVLEAAVEGRLVPTEAELARRNHRSFEPGPALVERILGLQGRTSSAGDWPLVPDGWAILSVDEVIQIVDYRGRTPPFADQGIPHLRSSNVRDGQVIWDGLTYVSSETYVAFMTRGQPQPGDVLLTTEAPLGEVALAPSMKFSLAQRLVLLRPRGGVLVPEFLKALLMSPTFQARLGKTSTGSTVTGISSRNLRPLEVLVPPIAEQRRIADELERRLSVAALTEAATRKNADMCAALRGKVLSRSFGEPEAASLRR